jgi:hypothetical protein
MTGPSVQIFVYQPGTRLHRMSVRYVNSMTQITYKSRPTVSDLTDLSVLLNIPGGRKSDRDAEDTLVELPALQATKPRCLQRHQMLFAEFRAKGSLQVGRKVPIPRVTVGPRLSRFVVLKKARGGLRAAASS